MSNTLIGRKRSLRELGEEDEKKNTVVAVAAPPSAPNASNSTSNSNSNPNHNQKNKTEKKPFFDSFYLRQYYTRLFPYEDLFNWLSYFNKNNGKFWQKREFSFTLAGDIYIRFQSFDSLDTFKKEIIKKNPYKIDIGAVYNVEPKRKNSIRSDRFIPEEKELVFDIDISDYDDVRTCCSQADICNKCWPLMSCAVKCVDSALRQDFGLQHVVWVFSGRRGIHAWIGDAMARKFDTSARSAIIDYLKLYVGNSQNAMKVDLNVEKQQFIHESLARSYDICKEYFVGCSLFKQNLLNDVKSIDYLVNQIRNALVKNDVKNELMKLVGSTSNIVAAAAAESVNENGLNENNSDDIDDIDDIGMDGMDMEDINKEIYLKRWNAIDGTFQKHINNSKSSREKRILKANRMEIVFSYVYPRLDVEVSRHKNHLLKCPFVVHPKTGKVCTIIDPNTVDSFDPLDQPTLNGLIKEYNEVTKQAKENNVEQQRQFGWQGTKLEASVQTFRNTFLNDLKFAQG